MIPQLLRDFGALFELTGPDAPGYDLPVSSGSSGARRSGKRTLWAIVLIVLAGAVVRFWGLGSIGLHGDEKTMALPVMSLVEHGTPLMPSGMFYPRAVAQLYLMAASVMAFGQSEWALRLPSALCGVLLIVLAWKAGGRFLSPAWSLALAAAVAFLPSFIEDAQTARMYVFLVTSVTGYMALLFAWERSGRVGYLLAAVATILIGIQFHTLAVFAAFLVFVPGLLQGDVRKFWAGTLAFIVIVAGFAAMNTWIGSAYPQSVESNSGAVVNGPHAAAVAPHIRHLWLWMAAVPALGVSAWVVSRHGVVAVLLLTGALVAELALAWHLAVLLIIGAWVMARRAGPLPAHKLVFFALISVTLAIAEVTLLVGHNAGTPKQIAGAMLGWPSVWPFIAIADYSLAAMLLVVAALARGAWLLALRKPVPDYLLFVMLGLWVPLLMIGFMKWNIPARYAAAQIMPLLLAAFAAAQGAVRWMLRRRLSDPAFEQPGSARLGSMPTWVAVAAVLACLLVVNPVHVARAMESGYARHPDHKGAAEFVASLHPGPRDILVAEDVLQQTYYLGHVDYWLVNKDVAAPFMHRVRGQWVDFYTDTPLIGTGVELEQLVERSDRGAIYVIGSGENQEDGRSLMRAFGISEALHSPPFHLVYRGRDGLTKVWKADAPSGTFARGG